MRQLSVADVSERYLSWLRDEIAQRFIIGAHGDNDMDELRSYVSQREARDDLLFLGIFTHDGTHIGNIKYEPIDSVRSVAVLGILIGEAAWRGLGVAGEVIGSSAYWLRDNRGIKTIVLGVDRDNLPAIHAYKKLGFVDEFHPLVPVDAVAACSMVWHL
ncbi:GNAT family N-acetyltransferase [Rhodoferax sp. TS-BS-61-7]|uniref:GNAT family N-acetyltransferase n=1 Tax=Rhodoferax sp. TS-BS-61-7 TaxID=2094194 RepID=UPI0021019B4D|nr:GNAT family N-acetyltransferase [Rhodoferax sp. TS-BS-61-7]